MNEVKKHLDTAFQLISTVPVKGDAVEVMAAARANLRAAYQLLDKQKEPETKDPEEVSEDG